MRLSGRANKGLFGAEGEDWSRLRRLMAPAFSHRNLAFKTNDLVNEAMNMVHRLSKYANTSQMVNMEDEAQNLTVRVISQVAIGGEDASDSAYFFGDQFAKDLTSVFKYNNLLLFYPYPRWVFKLSANYAKELAAIEGMRRMNTKCKSVIDSRRKYLASLPLEQDDSLLQRGTMLDVLIKHNGDDVTSAPISDEELIDNVRLLYIAGSETTYISICWAVFYLTQNPDVCLQIIKETDHLFANDAAELRQLTNVTTALPYTHAVLKEALRLASPAPLISAALLANNDTLKLSNGVVINPSDRILIHIDACLRDPEAYTNPDSFIPSRWLTSDSQALARMESHFYTFGGGRRICPGMGLAHAEAAIALAALVHHYDFQLGCPPESVNRVWMLTAKCERLPVIVKTRQT